MEGARAKIEGEGVGEDVDPNCRVCGKVVQLVGHLASGCGGLAQQEYKWRHDYIGVKYSERWYEVWCTTDKLTFLLNFCSFFMNSIEKLNNV